MGRLEAQRPCGTPLTRPRGRKSDEHPLLRVFLDAAAGRFPPVDGAVTYFPPVGHDLEAVVCFTGHAFICSRLSEDELSTAGPDGFGAAHDPEVLTEMTGTDGTCGVIDCTLVGRGVGGGSSLPEREDLDAHHRVEYAQALRSGVRVFGDDRGLITLSQGLAGRPELSVEAAPARHGTGAGRQLIREGLRMVGAGDPVFAAVSPGNARSLRAFLAVGFAPIGSEVVIRTAVS